MRLKYFGQKLWKQSCRKKLADQFYKHSSHDKAWEGPKMTDIAHVILDKGLHSADSPGAKLH